MTDEGLLLRYRDGQLVGVTDFGRFDTSYTVRGAIEKLSTLLPAMRSPSHKRIDQEKPMKCGVCGNRMIAALTNLPFKLSEERIVILKQLPVSQCTSCREYLIEDTVMARFPSRCSSCAPIARRNWRCFGMQPERCVSAAPRPLPIPTS